LKKRYLSSIIFLIHILQCLPLTTQAQGENNNWVFGQKLGINFNQNPPQLFESNMRSIEGCSAVSNAAGNLLFYTMGSRIWDRNGNEMPNSTGLLGNGPFAAGVPRGSSAHGAVIIPNPGSAGQYYIFCVDAWEQQTFNLYYSLVDMTLNGGLGDIVPTVKNVLLMTNAYEYLNAIRGGDCSSYWLLARTADAPLMAFCAFKVDQNGVSTTPVITPPPPMLTGYAPRTTFAPDGVTMMSHGSYLVYSKFNNLTGEVYNFVGIDPPLFGAFAFSADGTKLYVGDTNEGLQQLDLSFMPNTAAVAASVVDLDTSVGIAYTDLRLAPNGKIYLLKFSFMGGWVSTMSVINNPNVAGTGCNFDFDIFGLPAPWAPGSPFEIFADLGDHVPIHPPADTILHPAKDTLVCNSNTLQLQSSDEDATIFQWSTGASTATIDVDQPGTYWIRASNSCGLTTDTFNVQFAHIAIELGNDTTFCTGSTITLHAAHPDISNYQWSTGATSATLQVSQSGTYYVTGWLKHCMVSDTIAITAIQPELHIVENDTIICKDNPLVLHTRSNPESTFRWNNGDQDDQTLADTAGTYIVTIVNECGTYQDSVHIQVQDCNCRIFVPNVFSPNGDGKNDAFGIQLACLPSDYSFSIYNRYGQRIFLGRSPTAVWDGTYNGKLLDAGTYFYYIKLKGPTGTEAEYKGDIMLIR
jgi:gliding motility-associated-like protein